MESLQGKNIIITGASSGIGERLAINIALLGGRPILIARTEEKLQKIAAKIQSETAVNPIYFALDVSDLEKVHEVFAEIKEQVGFVDILVNNAGFGIFEYLHETSIADMERMFAVNVLGLIACTKEVLPSMLSANKGHIINIASQAGKLATAKSSGYSATKHAVLGFTNSLRMEVAKTNIRISAVNPGPIDTNFFEIADKSGNYAKNVEKFMLSTDYVADKITALILKPKRELNLPKWMNAGSVLYNLFPRIADRIMGGMLDKK
ncbi:MULTISPECIES: SDR family NAD(P)-dependent oxidoreductase [Bacillaceae]|uniref:SDR family NAD(P)-dependent oxidoreductase n=1 Tax=Bacillaceae TaxID=186817 RepID=UPI001E385CA1|nr:MULTISPECIES: SDR family oxidoreductase [Bacillaceae]MCE4047133.1 SDR family oxidoreductase [Bacillus sp. Au-Bac7]MCM3031279.1 SDR family oxidoreductase [Niallia sp. MER 6]